MVEKLLELKDEVDDIIQNQFGSHNEFQQTRMRAFYTFINLTDKPTL